MKIRLGYVAVPMTLDNTYCKTMTYKHYLSLSKEERQDKLDKIMRHNLNVLKDTLKYNVENGVYFYRLSHSLVPFATFSKVDFDYIKPYKKEWNEIGKYIKQHNMRVDTHPDQYCVLNSDKEEVVTNSVKILEYQYTLFKILGINSKCIIHVGGGKEDKEKALKRFKDNFNKLPNYLKNIIMLENDDTIFNTYDVLCLCEELNIPFVFDYHHNRINKSKYSFKELLPRIINTWKNTNLIPKMHLSSPKSINNKRSHHDYIKESDFLKWLSIVSESNCDMDLMLECKMKDEALFRLVRLLKHNNIKIINQTTIELN